MGGIVVVVLLVSLIIPTVVGHQVGKSKGRAGWAYGLFLSWLGVIIVAVLPPTDTRECPWCREPVRLGAGVCPHCQRAIPVGPVVIPRRRNASADVRPTAAQARLDEAARAVADRAYGQALSTMEAEIDEADGRGDVEALEELSDLATKVEQAPDVRPLLIRDQARELNQRLEQLIEKHPGSESEDSDAEIHGADGEGVAPVHGGSALEIVRERYARGEITREEFQQLQDDLA